MGSSKYYEGSFLLFVLLTCQISALKKSAAASFCGSEKADADKTCISIRLPWQTQPIYFCTDKESIKYRSNCGSVYESRCGHKNTNKDELLVATPWDCCPLTSTPDYCVNKHCSPAPFNRTCSITNQTSTSSFTVSLYEECCPKYFCEVDTKPEECNFKKLHAECMPPQNKTNCITFSDKHGCCDKYQCDEDDHKPGNCPNYAHYPVVPVNYNESNLTDASNNNAGGVAMTTDPSSTESTTESKYTKRYPYSGGVYYPSSIDEQTCIGDFTCPDDLKCCPEDCAYGYSHRANSKKFKHPVQGYCKKPVAKE